MDINKRQNETFDLDSDSSSAALEDFEDARNTMDFEDMMPENTDFAHEDHENKDLDFDGEFEESDGEREFTNTNTNPQTNTQTQAPDPEIPGLNRLYAEQFDEHVRGFFALTYMTRNSRILNNYLVLLPSVNNATQSYYLPRPYRPFNWSGKPHVEHLYLDPSVYHYLPGDVQFSDEIQQKIDDTKRLPGTLWSSSEKEMFFRCLARYLIHRLDAFIPHLPHKSTAEIEAYYHLLKDSLRRVTRVHKYKAYLYGEAKTRLRTDYAIRVWEDGVRYWRVPAAIEVDEQWVEFEEQQSQILAQRELQLTSQIYERQARTIRKYTKSDNDDVSGNDGNKNNDNNDNDGNDNDANDDEVSDKDNDADANDFNDGNVNDYLNIVDINQANALARVYAANSITPTMEGNGSCEVDFTSLVFLDELVKTRVRDMFLAILVGKGTNGVCTGDDSIDELETQITLAMREKIVSDEDVWKAASELRLFEKPKAGFRSRYVDGKTPLLATYWPRVVDSLKLSLSELPSDVEEEPELAPAPAPIMPLENEYKNTDFFLRPILSDSDDIELPEGLVAATAPELSTSGSSSEEDSENDGEGNLTVPQSWDLPAPWDLQQPEVIIRDSSENEAENGNGDVLDKEHENSVRPPERKAPTKESSHKVFRFMDLEPSETFARKRTAHDVKIEEYLNDDVDEYLEWRDRKMSHAYLRDYREQMGLPPAEDDSHEIKRNFMARSMIHRAWVKHFAGY